MYVIFRYNIIEPVVTLARSAMGVLVLQFFRCLCGLCIVLVPAFNFMTYSSACQVH